MYHGLLVGNIKFKAFDLEGIGLLRELWKDYYAKVDTTVYLVNAYDKERFSYAASEDEVQYNLGLTNFTTGKGKVSLAHSNVRPLEVFMCSIDRKMGYDYEDGF